MVNPSPVFQAFYLQAVCFFVLNCGYIYTSISLYHEGVLFFLLGEYLSYVADKIKAGGGGGILRYHSDFFSIFRFFFIFIQICLSWRVAGLHIELSKLLDSANS